MLIKYIVAISDWLEKTNEITSDSEDYKIIRHALDLLAFHIGHEAGRKAARNIQCDCTPTANMSNCQCYERTF